MTDPVQMHNDQAAPLNPQPEQETYRTPKRLIGGAIGGYLLYWLTRVLVKFEFINNADKVILQPFPYILLGVISAGLVEGARLAYEAGLAILGDRSRYENLDPASEATAFDRLRKHSWKVISHLETVPKKVDAVYSRIFNIRTSEEIYNQKILDRDLRTSEIARRAFLEQVQETMTTSVPQELGVYIVEACGYTILGAHAIVWLHGATFLLGFMQKVMAAFEEEEKSQKAKEADVNPSPLAASV